MGSVPLKLKDSADFQNFSSTEENYLSYQVGLSLVENDSSSPSALSLLGTDSSSYSVGSLVDTIYDSAIGTGGDGSYLTFSQTVTNLRQSKGTIAIADSDYRLPILQRDSDGQRVIREMNDSDTNVLLDRLNSRIFTSDYVGSYRLGSSAPSGDYSLFLNDVMTDTRKDGASLQYNIYQRTTQTAPTEVLPFSIKRSNGDSGDYQGLQLMTPRQVKYSLGLKAKNRIASANNSIGSYKIYSSAAGTPTDVGLSGTWASRGTATDTRQAIVDANYTRGRESTYSRLRQSNYSADYTRTRSSAYSADYTRTRVSNYSADYTTTRTSNYSLGFVGNYIGNYSRTRATDYTRNRASTLDYVGNYVGDFTGNYSRLLAYTGDFLGNYVGTISYTSSFLYNASTYYVRTSYVEGAFVDETWVYNGTEIYSNQSSPSSTVTVGGVTYVKGSQEDANYSDGGGFGPSSSGFDYSIATRSYSETSYTRTSTRTSNVTASYTRVSTQDFLGNYTRNVDYLGNYTGNFLGEYSADYTRTTPDDFSRNFLGNYTGEFTRTRVSTYTRTRGSTYIGNYIGNFTGDFTGNFIGNYVGTATYTAAYTYVRTVTPEDTGSFPDAASGEYYWLETDTDGGQVGYQLVWNGTVVASGSGAFSASGNPTTTINGVTYQRGTYQEQVQYDQEFWFDTYNYFSIRRYYDTEVDFTRTSTRTSLRTSTADFTRQGSESYIGNFTGNYLSFRSGTGAPSGTYGNWVLYYTPSYPSYRLLVNWKNEGDSDVVTKFDQTYSTQAEMEAVTSVDGNDGLTYARGAFISAPATGVKVYQTLQESGDFTRTSTRTVTNFEGNYARNFVGNYTGEFTRTRTSSFLGGTDYSRDFLGNFTGNYSRNFTLTYEGNYSRNFTGNYQGDYARDFIGDYSRTFTGDYAGDTIGSGNTTIETYTLYVRIA